MNNTKLSLINAMRVETCKQISKDYIYTGMKQCFPSGMEYIQYVKIPRSATKAALKPCIQELDAMGWTQKAIAFVTNMSQGYVSKLHR